MNFWLAPYLPAFLSGVLHHVGMLMGDQQHLLWGNKILPNAVWGMDPGTGAVQWKWSPPDWKRSAVAGDDEGLINRLTTGTGFACLPNPWGSPSMDATGTIYLPHQSGHFYVLK